MAQIVVDDLSEDLVSLLHERAQSEGRSVGAIIAEMLAHAAKPSLDLALAAADELRAMTPESTLDSTDLIREDRDNVGAYR